MPPKSWIVSWWIILVTVIISIQTNEIDTDDQSLLNSDIDYDDFCSEPFIDSAYFNGYDTILTRGDRLWYYYKDRHQLSRAYDQRRFTQGDHIQGAFNVSRTPYYCLNRRREHHRTGSLIDQNDGGGSDIGSGDCVELQKLQSMAIYFLHNKQRTRSYYNVDARYPNGTQKRVRSRDLPWNMKQVGLLTGNQLWPNGWEIYHKYRPVAYLPSRYELIFVMMIGDQETVQDPRKPAFQTPPPSWPVLIWNNLDAVNWNSSWRSRVLYHDPPITFTGMFEMNGVVYAIGEWIQDIDGQPQRVSKMFRYIVTENDSRDLKETEQSVEDFFGCPKPAITTGDDDEPPVVEPPPKVVEKNDLHHQPQREPPVASPPETNSIDESVAVVENRQQQQQQPVNGQRTPGQPLSVFLRNSRARITSVPSPNSGPVKPMAPYPKLAGVTLRETDSIMLTILIAIVIGASVLCIVLACLVINGKKRHIPPHFEGGHRHHLDHPVLGKPTIIGLDYHRRKNSTASSLTPFNFLSRYDSMNSLTAIYSQVHHHPQQPTPMMDGGNNSNNIKSPRIPPPVLPPPSPTPSPNLQALYPPRNNSGGTTTNNKQNKSVFANLSKRPAPARPDESAAGNLSNSSSVPNLATEEMADPNPVTTTTGTDRIKSFERFENLI